MSIIYEPMEEKRDIFHNSIFHGIEEDFEVWWKEKGNTFITYRDDPAETKKRVWGNMVNWCEEWLGLYEEIIPEKHTACAVVTLQQYEDFSGADIINVIEKLGRLARMMRPGQYDWAGKAFDPGHILEPREYRPLARYYYLALEAIMEMTATFWQPHYKFTDLTERMRQLKKAIK